MNDPIDEIFWQVRQFDSLAAREAFLEKLSASSPEQAAMVRDLIGREQQAADVFGKLSVDRQPEATLDSAPVSGTRDGDYSIGNAGNLLTTGDQIGPYKLLEPIGEGGMGVVYLAQQSKPVRRKVALKIIKPGMDSRQVVARFEAERQALAMMEHPNIARALDAGTTESGLPYFVMELVRGIPMTEYCDRARMTNDDRLKLFCDACSAIQHAHNKGIIHRDIKPSNVLITEHDGTPVVKVIDFGVAKALTDHLTDKTLFTGMFQMIGTPLYMSPEQASLSNLDVDVRSDVYSLGVMLYELISGTLPLDRATAQELSFEQLRQRICDTEPPRPSKRLSTLKDERETIAGHRGVDVKNFYRLVTSELDWIVMKAIEKDRKRRYQSARELAEDVQRYLDGDAVEACPPSFRYRTSRYFRRNRWLVGAATAVLLTAVLGSAVALWYALLASNSAKQAYDAQQSAEKLADDYKSLMLTATANAKAAKRSADQAVEAREQADQESLRARQATYVSSIRLAATQIEKGLHADAISLLAQHSLATKDDDLRNFEWYYLLGQANQSSLAWQASPVEVAGIDWSSDGALIATVDLTGACKVWNASDGRLLHHWDLGRTIGKCLRWSDDGQFLAWGTASDDAKVRIWDRQADVVRELNHDFPGSVWSIRWNQVGLQLGVGTITESDGPLDRPTLFRFRRTASNSRQWNLADQDPFPGNVHVFDWNLNETRLWALNDKAGIRIYDPSSFQIIRDGVSQKFFEGKPYWFAFAHHTSRCTIAAWDSWCVVLDEETQEEIHRFRPHWSPAKCCWSPDDAFLATWSRDGFVKVWDTSDWTLQHTFGGHQGEVRAVTWSPDAKHLAGCGNDGRVIVWQLDDQSKTQRHPLSGVPSNLRLDWVDESRIRFIRDNAAIAHVDVDSGQTTDIRSLKPSDGQWRLVGDGLAVCLSNQNTIIDCSDERLLDAIGGQKATRLAAIQDADGVIRLVVTPGRRTQPVIFKAQTASTPLLVGSEHFVGCNQIRWSPQGDSLAIAGNGLESDDGTPAYGGWLHVIDAANGRLVTRARVGTARVAASAVAWSGDTQRLVAASDDGSVGVYDREGLRNRFAGLKHRASVRTLDFHPDGQRIASGGIDQKVLVWDAMSGETLLEWATDSTVNQVRWSPSGSKLAALTADGSLHTWDATDGIRFSQTPGFRSRQNSLIRARLNQAISNQRWEVAQKMLGRLLELTDDPDAYASYQHALLCLINDHPEEYESRCESMWERFADSKDYRDLGWLFWTMSLSSDSKPLHLRATELAKRWMDERPNDDTLRRYLAAYLVRAGQPKNIMPILKATVDTKDTTTSPTYYQFFLSMAHRQLGDQDEARHWLQQGIESMDEQMAAESAGETALAWNRRATLQLLRNDATRLIEAAE